MEVKNKKKIVSLCILVYLAFYIAFYLCFLLNNYLKYAETITAANLIILTFIGALMLGYHKDKMTYLKKNVLKIVIIQVLFYFGLMYASGLVFGFLKNAYSLRPITIINNILAPVIIVTTSEILRYIIVSNNKEDASIDKFIIVLTTITLILVDVSSKIRLDMFTSSLRIFKISTSVFLPSIAKNLMLTYLTYHVGYRSSLIYRLVLDLYVYLVPIFPDLGEYVTAMLGVALPFLVYQYSSREIKEYNNGKEYEYNVNVFRPSDLVLIGVTIILICLISGAFPLYLLGIATGSMHPEIKVGDAVLVNKVNKDEEIKKGDVVVYEHDGLKIVHRITSKETNEEGKIIYRTKGDANNGDDGLDITIEEISGKVIVKIPFIGYPSVWLSEILN